MLKRTITHRAKWYEVVLAKEEDGGYSASVPAVPGAYSDGDTEEEALENISDAITMLEESEPDVAYILREHGLSDEQDVNVMAQPTNSEGRSA